MRTPMAMRWLWRVALLLVELCLQGGVVHASATGEPGAAGSWAYLIEKLISDGVDRDQVTAAFADRRVPPFDGLGFSLAPRESPSIYRTLRTPSAAKGARRCIARHEEAFRRAEKRFGVSASVVGAILHVESRCGGFTGNHVVLHRLARLAMANEPANLSVNIVRHTRGMGAMEAAGVEARVRARARELENIFYPEVLATFRLAERLGIDPLAIRGSPSGAFGLPQFLPSSYLRFAVDGNDDGQVSLYDPADAIASAANYLAAHGWHPRIGREQQREVIWAYNRSTAYIDAVLYLADRLR